MVKKKRGSRSSKVSTNSSRSMKNSVSKTKKNSSKKNIFVTIIALLLIFAAIVIISNLNGGSATGKVITGFATGINSGYKCVETNNICDANGNVVKGCSKDLVETCTNGCSNGVCKPAVLCPNGFCDVGEDATNCPQDCPVEESNFRTVCEVSGILDVQCCKDNSAASSLRRSNCCDYVCQNRIGGCTQTQVEDCNYYD